MKRILLAIAACASLATSASAHENDIDPRSGIALLVGGQVGAFLDPAARQTTTLGGGLDFRVVLGPRSLVGLEGGVAGTLRGGDGGSLASLALEGAARVHVPRSILPGALRPYLFAGACLRHYELRSVGARDDVLEIPFGVGLTFPLFADSTGHTVDLRFAYRPAWGADLDPSGAGGAPADLSGWNLSFALGQEL